jgi:hypothetical protein
VDEALGAPARHDLPAHLVECGRCRAELEKIRALVCEIEHGLAAELAVDPSPEFTSRVRRRLREEELRSRFPLWAAAAAVAALALTWVFYWQRPQDPPPISSRPPRATAQAETEVAPETPPAKPRPAPRKSPVGEEPEVLVPPGQAAAIWRFYASLRDGAVDPPSFLASPAPSDADLKIPEDLNLPSLELTPLHLVPLDPETKE